MIFIGGCMFMQPQQPEQTFSGTLHSVRPVNGGDPTGWVLSTGPEGFGGGSMALEVSRVKSQAVALDGKQVTVQGRMSQGAKLDVISFGVLSPSR
jgi:hypothetical protein